jgi:hypothetical protein
MPGLDAKTGKPDSSRKRATPYHHDCRKEAGQRHRHIGDTIGTFELCAVGCVRYRDGNGRTRETAFFRAQIEAKALKLPKTGKKNMRIKQPRIVDRRPASLAPDLRDHPRSGSPLSGGREVDGLT